MGQPNLDNPSARLPAQMTLDCVTLTSRSSHHTGITWGVYLTSCKNPGLYFVRKWKGETSSKVKAQPQQHHHNIPVILRSKIRGTEITQN